MLLIRLALPTSDAIVAKDIDNFVADFDLRTVADELGWGSPFTDDVFESVDELLVGLHSVDIGERGLSSDKDLSASVSTVYRRCIGINCVGRYRFVTSMNIEGWEWRFLCFFKIVLIGILASCVVFSNVLLMISVGNHPKYGLAFS